MEKLIIIIEKNGEESYSAYAEDHPFFGIGDSLLEVKKNVREAIEIFKKENEFCNWPTVLQNSYEIVYKEK